MIIGNVFGFFFCYCYTMMMIQVLEFYIMTSATIADETILGDSFAPSSSFLLPSPISSSSSSSSSSSVLNPSAMRGCESSIGTFLWYSFRVANRLAAFS